jgi:hypothetical protein
MLISLEKRFVLISNSKAGSTSLEEVLSDYAELGLRSTKKGKHIAWTEARRKFHFLFEHPDYPPESFFRFGVIRDPVDRFVSWYNYRFEPEARRTKKQPISIRELWELDDWVKFDRDGRKKLQRDVFVDDDGVCRFDLVLPLSMMEEYEQQLGKRLGIRLQIPRINTSRKLVSTKDLPPAFVAEIRDFYADDYEFLAEWRARTPEVLRPRARSQVKRNQAAARSGAAGTRAGWNVRKPLPASIAYLRIDPGKPAVPAGVAVRGAGVADGHRLAVRQPGGTLTDLAWGLPSPALLQRFPELPAAAASRFRLAGGGEPVPGSELVLVEAGGAVEVLAVYGQRA